MPVGQLADALFGGQQRANDKKKERDQLRENYKFNRQVWRDNKSRLKADRKQLKEQQKTALRNATAVAEATDQNNLNRYNDQLAIRDYQMQLQQQSYDKSVDLYNKQTGYNQAAAQLSINNAQGNANDALLSLGFEKQGLQNEFQTFLETQENNLIGSRNNFESAIRTNDIGKIANTAEFQGIQRNVNLGMANFQEDFQNQRAEAAFANQDAIIEALQAQGAVEARGVTGKTATRLAGNALSALGRNQAQLQNALLAGSRKLDIQLNELQNTLQTASMDKSIKNLRLDSGLLDAKNAFDLDTDITQDAISAENRDYDLNKEILLANEASIGRQYESAVAQIQNQLEGAQIQAFANLQLPPVDPPMPTAPIATPIPEFTPPRKLEDFDFGPQPILQSTADVDGFAPVVKGLNAAFAIATGIGALGGGGGNTSYSPGPAFGGFGINTTGVKNGFGGFNVSPFGLTNNSFGQYNPLQFGNFEVDDFQLF